MSIPGSGAISILDFAREKRYDSYSNNRMPNEGGINKFKYPDDPFTFAQTGNNVTLTRDTGNRSYVTKGDRGGGGSLKMVCSGTDSYWSSYGNTGAHDCGSASNNDRWVFSVYAKASVALVGQLFLFEAPSSGNYTAFTNAYISITTDWQRFSVARQLDQASTGTVKIRVDGPQASSTETIWWDGFQVEESEEPTVFSMNGPYSIYDLVHGSGTYSSVTFENTNLDSPLYPNTGTPHQWNEWYNYDHDFEAGGPICFISGTLITMADGSKLEIEKVKVDDMIMTVNMETLKIESNRVLQLANPIHRNLITVKFENGIENTNTFDHPYWVKGKDWCSYKPLLTKERYGIDTNRLEVGDICYSVKDKLEERKILSIEQEVGEDRQTYILYEIENNNNFLANDILVHNKVL